MFFKATEVKIIDTTVNVIPPLYVDLDGTFSKSDMLFESLVVALKINPLIIFMCFYWLLQGKSHLKYKLSLRADIAIELLPLNPEFYEFLLAQKENNSQRSQGLGIGYHF